MAALKKNVGGQNITFCLVSSTSGQGIAGASITAFVTKDGGSQTGSGGTFTSLGNGQYNYTPTQTETNANDIGIFVTATGAVPVNLDIHTDVCDANGLLEVGVQAINGFTLAAQALAQSTQSIVWGTVGNGSSATAVAVSALNNPTSLTATGQLIGRTIIFLGTTASGDMQAQASSITASSTGSTPTLTVVALTNAPANGDIFVIL
jgi:hypothetical protein